VPAAGTHQHPQLRLRRHARADSLGAPVQRDDLTREPQAPGTVLDQQRAVHGRARDRLRRHSFGHARLGRRPGDPTDRHCGAHRFGGGRFTRDIRLLVHVSRCSLSSRPRPRDGSDGTRLST